MAIVEASRQTKSWQRYWVACAPGLLEPDNGERGAKAERV
jgi:hypothetical protein